LDTTPPLIFLSYSTHDKDIAGLLKVLLEALGMQCFLAHEDIAPSAEWEGKIVDQLQTCDAFIPILTTSFPKSAWTDQETGAAVGLGKMILPLKIDIDPYGFIAKYQALKIGAALKSGDGHKIVATLEHDTRLGKKVRGAVIVKFLESNSFKDAASNSERLLWFDSYEQDELIKILQGSCLNDQIFHSFGAVKHLEALISKNKDNIPKIVLKVYRAFRADLES
jgi:hypothetical protein